MAKKKGEPKKQKRRFNPKDNKPDFDLDKKDAQLLKDGLSEDFSVNDHLIECVECFVKTLADASLMNACLVSCTNEDPKKGKKG